MYDLITNAVVKQLVGESSSYREILEEKLRAEDYDEEIFNTITFRQGDGLATIKSLFNPEEIGTDYWTITHYKCKNIKNVPQKERWRHSEATVKITTSDKSKDQAVNNSLNETMQVIFDVILKDPERRTIRNNEEDFIIPEDTDPDMMYIVYDGT
ncbi:uncharacterized protein LOC132947809 [Metopolophium dirhodum]|uniref:uncharacterized protein LOC132947809 n=1 Tax=Metopolophium dirhodum TaxID=44670 RepID=UPI0029905E4C|nr:uncharacterized protein LOC132947809 [Metopolophium dirhodum]